MKKEPKKALIYQAKNGKIEFRSDFSQSKETLWANISQIAELFERDKSVISRHIKNIFSSGELEKNSVVAKIATTASDGKTYKVEYYNLDMILSIGYRVDSKSATQFRIWATKTLKKHLVEGFTINKKRINQNYEQFLSAVTDVKALLPKGNRVRTEDLLELINAFAYTWFSLDAYDTEVFPKKGTTKKNVQFTAEELSIALKTLKKQLIGKKQATPLFGQEKNAGSLEGIIASIFQTYGGKPVYPTLEQKAAHLLYFMIKNHPFTDGNKRTYPTYCRKRPS